MNKVLQLITKYTTVLLLRALASQRVVWCGLPYTIDRLSLTLHDGHHIVDVYKCSDKPVPMLQGDASKIVACKYIALLTYICRFFSQDKFLQVHRLLYS